MNNTAMNDEKTVPGQGADGRGNKGSDIAGPRRRPARKKQAKAIRLFIGLRFPLYDELAPLREDLRLLAQDEPSLRISPPENLHITLKFLGPVAPERAAEIHALCAPICARYPQLEICSQGIGLFKNSVWVGVANQESLRALAADISDAAQMLGFAREDKAFVPHVTVARFGKDARIKLSALLEKFQTAVWGNFTARKCYLYQSETLQEGARYSVLQGYAFAADDVTTDASGSTNEES